MLRVPFMLRCLLVLWRFAAIEGSARIGVHRVVLESDSKNLVYALVRGDADLSENGVLIREARSCCIMSFQRFNFTFCPRTCNRVAHELANFGYGLVESPVTCGEDVLEFVSVLVASDIAVPRV